MSDHAQQLPLEVFFSYSHRDELLKDELVVHLASLKRQGVIKVWHDRMIGAGTEWAGQIDQHLASADVILLLISPDFIASDYCYDIETTRALERHERGEARVIPVILRPCDWHGTPFGKLQALPKDAVAVTRWPDRDEAFTNVAVGIRTACQVLTQGASNPAPAVASRRIEPTAPGAVRVSDSGNLVLLAGRIYEAELVEEAADGTVQVRVVPNSGEDDAALRAMQGDRYGRRESVSFAHHNQAFQGRVEDAARASTGSGARWTISVRPEEGGRDQSLDMIYNGLSVDDQAELRARLLLLNERPSKWETSRDPMLKSFLFGPLQRLGMDTGLFPRLWSDPGPKDAAFLKSARLVAVYFLIASNICEHVLDLTIGPAREDVLDVEFRGRRRRAYSNVEPSVITVKGKCPLTDG